jgi:hypothetical protein
VRRATSRVDAALKIEGKTVIHAGRKVIVFKSGAAWEIFHLVE